VLGVGVGTVLGLPLVYLWGEAGVAPYLVVIAGTTLLVSWWYAHKIPVAAVSLSWVQSICATAGRCLRWAFAYYGFAGFATLASTYLVKVVIVRANWGWTRLACLKPLARSLIHMLGLFWALWALTSFPHLA
jgi:enterobacterial common antigen flippase